MRRIIRLLSLCTAAAWLVLCLPCIALASGYDGESVLLLATDKLSTRNGPGTKYRETGTFDLRGEYVTVLTCEEDANGVSWVECEFAWKGELMRVYTGLKRFACEDASEIFYALPWYFDAKALRTVPARYAARRRICRLRFADDGQGAEGIVPAVGRQLGAGGMDHHEAELPRLGPTGCHRLSEFVRIVHANRPTPFSRKCGAILIERFETKKAPLVYTSGEEGCGSDLLSRAVSSQVPSAC